MYVAGILVLAGVIFGATALSKPKSQPEVSAPSLPVVQPADQSKGFYDRAMEASASGDATSTRVLLEEALVKDPDNEAARRALAAMDAEVDEPAPTVVNNDAWLKSVSDLGKLLPASAASWKLGIKTVVKPDAVRSGEPAMLSTPSRTMRRVIFSVHDMKTETAALSFVTNVGKKSFPKNGASVVIGGSPGYFGTDGTRLAAVVFTRGRYAFEAVVTTNDGVAPLTAKDAVIALANRFPTTP